MFLHCSASLQHAYLEEEEIASADREEADLHWNSPRPRQP